ncbi:cation efflux family-domain-containing protein [Pavlovales sp. CCMP2436]|nr:cation efflux family-domain-containing protein [Pavlovales sp. CCMP2436]|mmetsp:Transcript_432/g.1165  ORF Transcript_432/g.1165 Transcript_432/m.1165 type:complete len:396 (+) Transcript_432:64-1251(+)
MQATARRLLGAPLLAPDDAPALSGDILRLARSREHTVVIEPTVAPTRAFSVKNLDRLSRRAHVISFWANLALFLGKLYVYNECRSMAILASLVDSTIDLLAQGVLMWANRASAASDVTYPAGRARLEPVGVVTCALLMAMASLQVIREASAELLGAWASGTTRTIDLRWLDAGVMLSTVLVKTVLYFWCREVAHRTSNVTVEAVAQDNLNDVLSNGIALIAALSTQLRPSFWLCDPLGALVISVYIIFSWARTGVEQVEMIVGRSADPEFLDIVRELAETHDPSVSLDVLRAYHFGPKFLVELEIVMPEDTPLRESHDVGIELQHKIESLESVERCFVHIDYQLRDVDDHDPLVPLAYKTAEAHRQPQISSDQRNRVRALSFSNGDMPPVVPGKK